MHSSLKLVRVSHYPGIAQFSGFSILSRDWQSCGSNRGCSRCSRASSSSTASLEALFRTPACSIRLPWLVLRGSQRLMPGDLKSLPSSPSFSAHLEVYPAHQGLSHKPAAIRSFH
ncbi:hypothetical protein J3459_012157 [Metarhizium acridum]|nr:hypothetical protein J3459_012157 [Metarhizium acridum]